MMTHIRSCGAILLAFLLHAGAQEPNPGDAAAVRVSGNNQLNGSYGTILYDPHKPLQGTGTYCTDYLDFEVGIKNFFVRSTFLVNSPSLGYNPAPEIFSEAFHRRTVGFTSGLLNVEAGHFKTAFGKGLTLNLRESRKTEKNYILDGVMLGSELPWLSARGFTGRSVEGKSMTVDISAQNLFDTLGNNKVVSTSQQSLDYRDNVSGVCVELFGPAFALPALSFLSASSLGGGAVLFGSKVEKPGFVFVVDTSDPQKPDTGVCGYQNRAAATLPFYFFNLSLGKIEFYAENALLFYDRHQFVQSAGKETIADDYFGYAGYASLGGGFSDFYFSGEYKNYHYAMRDSAAAPPNPGFHIVKDWVEAPDARHKHGWHLLTKHVLARPMDDDIGYNATLTWSKFERAIVKANFSIGGKHVWTKDSTSHSPFGFSEKDRYWELYSQCELTLTDRLNALLGVDAGIIDPQLPDLLDRTLAAKFSFGPYREKHSFELTIEAQYNTMTFSPAAAAGGDIAQDIMNVFIKPAYNFSPYVSLFAAFEREGEPYADYAEAKTGKKKEINTYVSGGVTVTPSEQHTLSIEAGTISGRMECNPPPCTYVQPFKGIKVTLNSMF